MNTIVKILRFYLEGFRTMTLGRTLWAIVLVKLFIMFAVLKLFFFPDFLRGKSEAERRAHVRDELLLAPCASEEPATFN